MGFEILFSLRKVIGLGGRVRIFRRVMSRCYGYEERVLVRVSGWVGVLGVWG